TARRAHRPARDQGSFHADRAGPDRGPAANAGDPLGVESSERPPPGASRHRGRETRSPMDSATEVAPELSDVRKQFDETTAVEAVLGRFELTEHRLRRIEELSKGNQQKVQLAGVMVADPDLLLLDEPMSGLDPVNVILVREVLQDLRRRGKTIVLSTHMMA